MASQGVGIRSDSMQNAEGLGGPGRESGLAWHLPATSDMGAPLLLPPGVVPEPPGQVAPPGASGVRLRGHGSPKTPRGPNTALCPPSHHATVLGALAGPRAPSCAHPPTPPGLRPRVAGLLWAPCLQSSLHGRLHPGGGFPAAAGQGARAGSGQGLAVSLSLLSAQPLLLSLSMATHTKSPTHHHLLTLPCRVNWHLT